MYQVCTALKLPIMARQYGEVVLPGAASGQPAGYRGWYLASGQTTKLSRCKPAPPSSGELIIYADRVNWCTYLFVFEFIFLF